MGLATTQFLISPRPVRTTAPGFKTLTVPLAAASLVYRVLLLNVGAPGREQLGDAGLAASIAPDSPVWLIAKATYRIQTSCAGTFRNGRTCCRVRRAMAVRRRMVGTCPAQTFDAIDRRKRPGSSE